MAEGQVVVTGGSRGIGAAIAEELTHRGVAVVCLSRSGAAAAGRAMACDVTDEQALVHAFEQIAARGPISGLVNNAGIHVASPSGELPTEEYDTVMRVNAAAVMIACREIYPHLKAAGGGLIVNIGSFFDKLGVAGNLAYCASKAAVGAITRCLAVEWAADGINVVNVAPGYIETDMNREFLANERVRAWLARRIPVARPGTSREVARLVAALFAERIAFLTGETIYIDGGQGMHH